MFHRTEIRYAPLGQNTFKSKWQPVECSTRILMWFSVLVSAIFAEKMCVDSRQTNENVISARDKGQKYVLQALLIQSIRRILPAVVENFIYQIPFIHLMW